jgi:hypothetical protein
MAGYDDEEYAQYGSSFEDRKFANEPPVHDAPMSHNYGNGEIKPRVLLMGLKKSGKSSIQKVVFQKMSPNETLFLESTTKLVKSGMKSSFSSLLFFKKILCHSSQLTYNMFLLTSFPRYFE